MHRNPVNALIIGVGGHARVIAGILQARGVRPAGFLDGLAAANEPGRELICGVPVLGNLEYLSTVERPEVIVAVGDNVRRAAVVAEVLRRAPGAAFPEVVHPTAILECEATVAAGVHICAAAVLCAMAQVGEGAIINTAASIDHECLVGRYCHVSPGARLAGRVTVGEFTHVGIGAVVIEKITIGHHVMVGAGAVVIRDVPDYATVVGNPARIIKIRK